MPRKNPGQARVKIRTIQNKEIIIQSLLMVLEDSGVQPYNLDDHS